MTGGIGIPRSGQWRVMTICIRGSAHEFQLVSSHCCFTRCSTYKNKALWKSNVEHAIVMQDRVPETVGIIVWK